MLHNTYKSIMLIDFLLLLLIATHILYGKINKNKIKINKNNSLIDW